MATRVSVLPCLLLLPVFYAMGSGNVGLQIGALVSEVALLLNRGCSSPSNQGQRAGTAARQGTAGPLDGCGIVSHRHRVWIVLRHV
jgi:hypothetical protein